MLGQEPELRSDFPVETVDKMIPCEGEEEQHWHPWLELGLCKSGMTRLMVMDQAFVIKPGDLYFIKPSQPHSLRALAGEGSECLILRFKAGMLEADDPELMLGFGARAAVVNHLIPGDTDAGRLLGRLTGLIGEELEHKPTGYKGMVRGMLLQACALLARHFRAQLGEREWSMTVSSLGRIMPALRYIKERLHEPIQLQDVADHISLSTSRTYHLFKETIGEGFKEHLIKLRVREAQKLLAGSDLPITEICAKSGFTNHASFYRSFHSLVQMTPSEYRNKAGVMVDLKRMV